MKSQSTGERPRSGVPRLLKVSFVVFAFLVVAIVVAVWIAGGEGTLPFVYEGFD